MVHPNQSQMQQVELPCEYDFTEGNDKGPQCHTHVISRSSGIHAARFPDILIQTSAINSNGIMGQKGDH